MFLFFNPTLYLVGSKSYLFRFIDIGKFMLIFCYKHLNFGGNIQQDAQEFIRLFLEDLSSELNEIINKPNHTDIYYTNKSSKFLINKQFQEFFLKSEKSFIIDLFLYSNNYNINLYV